MTMMRNVMLIVGIVAATPALADFDSAYTSLDFNNVEICTNLTPAPTPGEPDDGVVYECQGFGPYVVSFQEGDLRSFVAYGTESGDHCSAMQTFGGFNSVGSTIEWRLKDGKPIATILRWSVSYDPEDSSKQMSWLVVTRLEAENSCHMAYVEGAYPKANEEARDMVDKLGPEFSCAAGKPVFLANPGTATEGIAANEGCSKN